MSHDSVRRARGQVNSKDWPWSSFSFYAKNEAGLAGIDAVDL
jgi:hypothetical protein